MSYFLFGAFEMLQDEKSLQLVKKYARDKDIYIWFNEEICFCQDIERMLVEQKIEGNYIFAITSKNQPSNSCDVIFPFDKFSNEELFADESRTFYKKCCRENINILFDCLKILFNVLNTRKMKILVVEGYDDIFFRKECSIELMKKDLLNQIEERMCIDSCIYFIG